MKRLPEVIFFTILLFFSWWLMFHTFSYDSENRQILISAKAWSDFGWMLPLVRSFSLGNNWPPQNPFYPGEPLKYHFLFHLLVGSLEKVGVRIDWAFNIPSAIGFFFLIVMIYLLSKKLFSNLKVSILSLVFFLFNGSLSFIEYFHEKGWSWQALTFIPKNTVYPAFGPWDGSDIAAIWNLNIFTNQRPFGLSLGLVLMTIYLLYVKYRAKPIILGLIIGLLTFLNQGLLPGVAIILGFYGLFVKKQRKTILIALTVSIPFILISKNFINSSNIIFHPGFLIREPINFMSLFKYWFANLGIHLFLIPLGWYLAPKQAKLLPIPLIGIFLLPNLFQFSPDMFNNHKLFNLFIIIGGMFTAYALITIWNKRIGKIIVPLLLFFLTFSGIIDFFALYNDYRIPVNDVGNNKDAFYIFQNTSPKSVILNSTWFYHPASIAGRPIYNGYPYFTWAHGYDQITREKTTVAVYSSPDLFTACSLLVKNNISYVELSRSPESFIHPNYPLWDSLPAAYTNPSTLLKIYSVSDICQKKL